MSIITTPIINPKNISEGTKLPFDEVYKSIISPATATTALSTPPVPIPEQDIRDTYKSLYEEYKKITQPPQSPGMMLIPNFPSVPKYSSYGHHHHHKYRGTGMDNAYLMPIMGGKQQNTTQKGGMMPPFFGFPQSKIDTGMGYYNYVLNTPNKDDPAYKNYQPPIIPFMTGNVIQQAYPLTSPLAYATQPHMMIGTQHSMKPIYSVDPSTGSVNMAMSFDIGQDDEAISKIIDYLYEKFYGSWLWREEFSDIVNKIKQTKKIVDKLDIAKYLKENKIVTRKIIYKIAHNYKHHIGISWLNMVEKPHKQQFKDMLLSYIKKLFSGETKKDTKKGDD